MRDLPNSSAFRRSSGRETATWYGLRPAPAAVIDDVPIGRLYRDGAIITRSEDGQVRERRKLSFAGTVSVSLVLSDKGALLADPEVALSDRPRTRMAPPSRPSSAKPPSAPSSRSRARAGRTRLVSEAVRRGVRAAVNQAWGKKPGLLPAADGDLAPKRRLDRAITSRSTRDPAYKPRTYSHRSAR